MNVSVVNFAGSSFCWNYATDTFYNYAVIHVCNYACLLQLCRFWGSTPIMLVILSAAFMLVDLSIAVVKLKVTVSVAVMMQLEVSAILMQVKVYAANMWVRHFLLILCRWESLLQSCRWVHYADYFYCNYMEVAVSIVGMYRYVTASSSNFIFLSLPEIHFS